jgi:2-polyprenyl-6-methoxyphenol hydroxylase-like FAD-dependent oxidoreductase
VASASGDAVADGEEHRRALIVGAGPAGLAAAIALTRIGIDVRLFERQSELGRIAGGLGVQSNALRALQKLGVGERIVAAGTELRAQEICDIRGRRMFSFPMGEVADEYGTPTISLLRSEVQRTLLAAVAEGVVRKSSECVAVEQDADGVSATFADGSVERGALLIGADGGKSVVRRHVYGSGDTAPRYSGFTSWRSLVDIGGGVLPPGTARTYLGAGKQFVMFPVGGETIYWGLMKGEPEGAKDPSGDLHRLLIGHLRDFPEVARRLVEATGAADILRADVYDRDPEQTWHRGRVLVIGDAAHMTTPFAGQGAGISMEDAVVLAKELSLTQGLRDQRMLGPALDSFERARMKRCAKIVLTSRRRGQIFSWSNPAVVAVRNAALRAVPARVWRDEVASSIEYDI